MILSSHLISMAPFCRENTEGQRHKKLVCEESPKKRQVSKPGPPPAIDLWVTLLSLYCSCGWAEDPPPFVMSMQCNIVSSSIPPYLLTFTGHCQHAWLHEVPALNDKGEETGIRNSLSWKVKTALAYKWGPSGNSDWEIKDGKIILRKRMVMGMKFK